MMVFILFGPVSHIMVPLPVSWATEWAVLLVGAVFLGYRRLGRSPSVWSRQCAFSLLEAKRADVPSPSGKEQAREYADSIGVRHVFLSNGDLHDHWATDSGNPVRIMVMPKFDEMSTRPTAC